MLLAALAVILLDWTHQSSSTQARLRGISAVNARVAWASGSQGTILRTSDGGATWRALRIAGAEQLDFRDIDALDERTAYVLSIGPGEASRIYRTNDAGASWELQFTNHDPKAFFDAMAFASARRGFAFSDSVDGRHVLIETRDGRTWHPVTGLPAARPGEGAFAASGSNIAIRGRQVWIGLNSGRVLRSRDDGCTWTVDETGIASSASAGIFSIAFRDDRHGVAVGGDFRRESVAEKNAAITEDGGRSWHLVSGLTGYRSAVAYLTPRRVIAIGPTGADLSEDGGRTWRRASDEGFDAFSRFWATGVNGRIARLSRF